MNPNQIIKKAEGFKENPEIGLVKEFLNLSELLERVISAIQEVKNEPTVNAEFLKNNPIQIENKFEGLREAINAIIPAIKTIKEVNMSGVENLLGRIADKEQKEIDLSELSSISGILGDILEATNKLNKVDKEEKKQEVKDNKNVIKAIDDVYEIINTLNENVVKADFGFDYERLEKIIKKIKVGGGGPAHVTATIDNATPIPVSGTVTANAGSANIVIDANNTTSAVLAAGATYTGTATDVLGYLQAVIQIYGRPGVVAGDGSSAKGSFYFELSKDGTNWDTSVPSLVRDPSLVIPTPIIFAHKFFRVKYINDGGASAIAALGLTETAGTPTLQTVFRLTTYLLPQATKELTRTLDQGISGSDPVNVVRSVGMGKNPDGDYTNTPVGGVVTSASTSTPLGASGVYNSSVFPRKGYVSLSISVAVTGVTAVSGTDGLQVFHYKDAAGTITAAPADKFTLDSTLAANGGLFITTAPKADYLKIQYTNGGVAQTTFQLETNLQTNNVEQPRQNLEGSIATTSNATMVRNIMAAKDPTTGTYLNITRSTTNGSSQTGEHVAIVKHEVETPIKALAGLKVTRTGITTTAVKVLATPMTNRRSIGLKSMCSGSALIYLGTNSSVTAGNGHPLSDGQSVDMELDDTVTEIWAIASTGTQALSIIEVST